MISNTVIDLSHHNGGTLNFANAKADGIIGVIQKATQGTGFVDPTFQKNHDGALAAGLLFGAYHFGTGSDGVEQADHFLSTVQPDAHTLVALDFEDNPVGPSMTLEEAQAFVTHIKSKLGRFPVFYSGHTIKRILGSNVDPVLKNCPLWLSQFGPTPVVPACWKTFTLWQYTDGAVGPAPHSVNGIGTCDREKFNGSDADLKAWWASDNQAQPQPAEV
jgi:lysozyme